MFDPVEVVVLGAGTAGLATAQLLAQKGVGVAIIDPFRVPVPYPRATHLDDETMRIIQTLGLTHLEKDFLRYSTGGYQIYDAHNQIIRNMSWRPEPTAQGWHGDYQFFQPDFENALRGRLHGSPHAQIWFGWRAQSIEQTDQQVTVNLRNERTGQEQVLTSRYLVGCDGARSMVRKLISPDVTDFHGTHRSLILDIAPLVHSPAVPHDDAFTRAIPPNPITVLPISHGMVRFEWLLNSHDETADFEVPERWYDLLKPFYKPGDYRIARADVYRWESLLPTRWRDRNIFVAGDAAHQMPPHLGQGMGSGLRDAMNLCWKLAACLDGTATEVILDTYQTEREPHVSVYIAAAVSAANSVEWLAENPGELGEPPKISQAPMPLPQLGPGLHGETCGSAGAISIQPYLLSGERLDDAIGYNFAVVGDPTLIAAVEDATVAAWQTLGATVINELSLPLRTWLNTQGVHAVIIRPDRYVYGAASTAAELDQLTSSLLSSLRGASRANLDEALSVEGRV